jgi:hypothetical protein
MPYQRCRRRNEAAAYKFHQVPGFACLIAPRGQCWGGAEPPPFSAGPQWGVICGQALCSARRVPEVPKGRLADRAILAALDGLGDVGTITLVTGGEVGGVGTASTKGAHKYLFPDPFAAPLAGRWPPPRASLPPACGWRQTGDAPAVPLVSANGTNRRSALGEGERVGGGQVNRRSGAVDAA